MKIILDTERLSLTTSTKRMIPEILDFYKRNKEHLEPWESARDPRFYTQAYQRVLQRYENEQLRKIDGIDFWIYHNTDNRLVGKVVVFHIMRGNFSNCMLGYKLDQNYQSQGFMHEALEEVIRFLFEDMNLHRAEINIIPRNTKSIHVAERLGFTRECVSKSFVEVNGVWEDHARYAKLNPTYRSE